MFTGRLESMENLNEAAPELAKKIMEAYFCNHDIEGILSYMDPSVTWVGYRGIGFSRNYEQLEQTLRSKAAAHSIPDCVRIEADFKVSADYDAVSIVSGRCSGYSGPEKTDLRVEVTNVTFAFHTSGEDLKAFYIHTTENCSGFKDEEGLEKIYEKENLTSLKEEIIKKNKEIEYLAANLNGGMMGCYNNARYSIYYISQGVLSMLGYLYDEFMDMSGGTMLGAIYPPDLEQAKARIEAFLDKGDNYSMEYRMRKKNGDIIWVLDSGRRVLNDRGGAVLNSFITDVTDRKQAELDREATYNNLPGGVVKFLADADYTIVEANDSYYRMIGIEPGKRLEIPCQSIYEADKAELRKTLDRQVAEGAPVKLEYQYSRTKGELVWHHLEGRPVGTKDGRLLYLAVVLDITEQKKLQINLEKEQERYRIAMESSADILFEYDLVSDIFYSYENEEKDDESEIKKRVIINYRKTAFGEGMIHPEDGRKIFMDLSGCNFNSAEVRVHFTTDPEGTFRWCQLQGSRIYNNNRLVRIVGTIRDISAIKKKEEENIRLQEICSFAISNDFDSLTVIHTLTGTCERYSANAGNLSGLPQQGSYMNQLCSQADTAVYEEDREKYLINMQIEALTRRLNDDNKSDIVYYRSLEEKEVRWKAAKVMYFDNDKNYILLSIRDIQNMVLEEQKQLILDQSYDIAMKGIYEEIFQVNLSTGEYKTIRCKNREMDEISSSTKFSEVCNFIYDRLLYPDDREMFHKTFNIESIWEYFESGETSMYIECRRRKADGQYHWMAVTMVPAEDKVNSGILIMGFVTDIDSRKRREQEERKQDERYSVLLKNSCEQFFEINIETGQYHLIVTNTVNRPLLPETGDYNELVRSYARDYIIDEQKNEYVKALSLETMLDRLKDGSPEYTVEYTLVFEGKKTYLTRSSAFVKDDNGGSYILSYAKNVTDSKNEEQKMQEERNEFNHAISALYEEIIRINLTKGTYSMVKVYDSENILPTEGKYDREIKKYCKSLIHPDDRKLFLSNFSLRKMRRLIDEGNGKIDRELRRKNGDHYEWVELQAISLPHMKNGDITAIMTYRNINQIKSLEADKKLVNERFGMAMRNSYDEVFEANVSKNELFFLHFGEEGLSKISNKTGFYEEFNNIYQFQIHPEDKEKFRILLHPDHIKTALLENAQEINCECRRKDQYGSYHWTSFLVQPMEGEESNAGKIMIFLKNVDAVKQEEERNRKALTEALEMTKQASNAKSDFLSRMSHDIRTPMNAIIGMSDIAEKSLDDTERVADCLSKIDTSAHFLLSLINDVLDMSRIESGKLTISKAEFNFVSFVDGIATMISDQAREKGLNFHIDITEEIGHIYIGDSLRLNQVIINLLSNAIKFTPEGGRIDLIISPMERIEQDLIMRFIVRDTGIGMSREFIEKMYSPFEQESGDITNQYGGTGLGLSITNNLISLMDGTIDVKSRQGEGTEFTVEIPLGITDQEAPEDQEEQGYEFHGEKILLVEDNDLNMEITRTILTYQPLIVEEAINGQEAIDMFRKSNIGYYDAILMDLRMPVKNGLEATREIRAMEREDSRTVPIIAMSANAFKEDIEQSHDSGMNDHLTKPVNVEVLYRTLYRQFQEKKR